MQGIEQLTARFELPARPICFRLLDSQKGSYLIDLLGGESVILEKIDTARFEVPEAMAANAEAVSKWLDGSSIAHIVFYRTHDSKLFCEHDGGLWRCRGYIGRMHSLESPISDEDAKRAARALGDFHAALDDIPLGPLKTTLGDFHNTPKIFDDFRDAVDSAADELKNAAAREISFALRQRKFTSALLAMQLPARAVHNNIGRESILLGDDGQEACIIPYDYVMPGLLCFDFGALVCALCHDCADDESDLEKIRFDIDRYADIAMAYVAAMRVRFDKKEPSSLAPGCVVMALEQGIKHLMEYLKSGDEQSLFRARVQLMLCMQMQYYYKEAENIIKRCF